jgi:hypothetical protein
MSSTLKNTLLAVLFILTLSGCTKDDPELSLPAVTEDGRNTLGLKWNGKVWVNYGDICNWGVCEDNKVTGRLHTYKDGSKAVIIEAFYIVPDKRINQMFQVVVHGAKEPGTYELDRSKEDRMTLVIENGVTFYSNEQDTKATLVLTKLDLQNNIISGTFSGSLRQNGDPSKTVEITDGRFDTRLTFSND